jgi:hypothetical protein
VLEITTCRDLPCKNAEALRSADKTAGLDDPAKALMA